MNEMNGQLKSTRYSGKLIGLLCVIGIVYELMWVLSYVMVTNCVDIGFFCWIENNEYLMSILIALVRLSILGAVLAVTKEGSQVYIRTQDLLIVRLIRVVGIGYAMYMLLDSPANKWSYYLIIAYYMLMALEGYLLIILLIKASGRIRAVYVIEILAIAWLIVFGMVRILSVPYSPMFVCYCDIIRFGVNGLLYFTSYIIAISLLLKRRYNER